MSDRRWLPALALLSVSLPGHLSAQQAVPWHDPSPHTVQLVTVDENVQLEVLDWGGTGRPVVLLAGSGNTAHVFDGFAEKLTSNNHIYGITRRGFGASSHPDSGYTDQRLADDVLRVLDALSISAPVLVGHSMAGSELTTLGAKHSDRLSGLVYLEAVRDPTRDYSELTQKLPTAMQNPPRASEADRKSFQAYRDWQTQTLGFALPESELRNEYTTNPDGSMGKYKTPGSYLSGHRRWLAKARLCRYPAACARDRGGPRCTQRCDPRKLPTQERAGAGRHEECLYRSRELYPRG